MSGRRGDGGYRASGPSGITAAIAECLNRARAGAESLGVLAGGIVAAVDEAAAALPEIDAELDRLAGYLDERLCERCGGRIDDDLEEEG